MKCNICVVKGCALQIVVSGEILWSKELCQEKIQLFLYSLCGLHRNGMINVGVENRNTFYKV